VWTLCQGALGGIGLCLVAVPLAYASGCGHALIDRELYLPAGWAEDEERRLLRHVPDEIGFATKPQLAAAILARARDLGIPARWFAGDEVYGCLELRRTARSLGFDYAHRPGLRIRPSTGVPGPGLHRVPSWIPPPSGGGGNGLLRSRAGKPIRSLGGAACITNYPHAVTS
jgi:SRSO17 transposase